MKIRDYFIQHGIKYTNKKGEIIMSPALKPNGVYFIEEGYILAYSVSNKKRRIQTVLEPSNIFPMLWGIKNTKKDFYTEALNNVVLYKITRDKLLHLIDTSLEISAEIIKILTSYLDTYFDRIENLEMNSIREKLIARLFFLSNRFGQKKNNTIIILFPVTHKFLAESIHVSRENVTRILNQLQKDKIVSLKKQELIILQPKLLEMKLNRSEN